MISKEQVTHVAGLAKLAFDESQLESFTSQFDKIVDFVNQLNEVDTTNVTPTTHVTSAVNVFREDVPQKGEGRAALLKNVPEESDGLIRVPSIIDKEEEEKQQ